MNIANGGDLDRRTWWQVARTCSGTRIDRRNYLVFLSWLTAWAVSFLAATVLLQRDFFQTAPMSWMLVLIPTTIGILALLAYLRFLRTTSGLLRQIQIDGISFGFGTGVVIALGYQVFEHAGAPEMRVSHVVAMMMIGWATGQIVSLMRYR